MKPYESIKKTLRDYEAPIDNEKLWGQTRHAIPQRKRRRVVVIWMLAGLGLLGVTALYTVQQTYSSENMDATPHNASKQIIESPDHPVNQRITHTETNTTSADAVKNSAAISTEIPNAKDQLKTAHSSTTSATHPSANQNDRAHTLPNDHSPQQPQPAGSSSAMTSMLHTSASGNPQPEEMPRQAAMSEDEDDEDALSKAKTDLIPRNKNRVSQLDALPILELNLIKNIGIDPILPGRITKTESHRLHIGLGIMQSIGSSSLSVSTEAPEHKQLATILQKNIRSLEVLTSTATANIQINRGLEVSTSIQRHQLTTSSSFEWTETELVPGTGISEIIIDEFGNQHLVIDEIDFIRTTDWQSTRYSTHHWYNLSLALSYPILRSYRINLLGGLHTNYVFAYNANGAYYDADRAPFEFNQEDRLFDSPNKWTLGLHSHIRWQLSHKWNARFSLTWNSFQYQIRTHPLQFDHSLWSIGAGIGYQFQ